jgi:hypothetical protein
MPLFNHDDSVLAIRQAVRAVTLIPLVVLALVACAGDDPPPPAPP